MFDEKQYIKRHLFVKRNIFMIIFLLVIFLIVFVSISFSNTYFSVGEYMSNKKYGLTNIHVISKDQDYSNVYTIDHIIATVSHKYYGELYMSDIYDNNTEIKLVSLLDEKSLDIVFGRSIKNSNEMICNNSFYPYVPKLNNNNFTIDKSLITYGKNNIGNKYTFKSLDADNDSKYVLKIVGTYDGEKIMDSINTCYVSPEIIGLLHDKCNGYIISEVPSGDEVLCEEYEGIVVRVDSINNVKSVITKLKNMGYDVFQYDTPDDETIALYSYGPLIIIIFILLISMIIIDNYLKKKILERKRDYGILKIVGFNKENIIKYELIENIIIFISSFIISFIIFIILFNIVKNNYLLSFVYEGYNLKVPVVYLLILSLAYIGIIFLFVKRKINRLVNKSIVDLLGE